MRIAKVPAARALGEIAPQCGEVTDLRRGETRRGGGDAGIVVLDPPVRRNGRNRREGADGGGATRAPDDAVIARQHEIDDRTLRHAGAAAFGKVGAGGAEFGRCGHGG